MLPSMMATVIMDGRKLIDRTAGTNIGDMTGAGGLAAAFDGTTSQAQTACATSTNTPAATFVYCGKTLAARKVFAEATVYGSNDAGYVSTVNPTVTIRIVGKQGTAPVDATNGTNIGEITFTDTSDESTGRTIVSTNTTTGWDHIWAVVRHTDASNRAMRFAEIELWEWA